MRSHSKRPFILIVDDTPENIQVMASILSKEGYNISPALNGQEALERVKMFSPDLVLLDLIMPGMSGFEVLEILHQNYSSTPVIVVTTETNPDVAAECLRKGAIDYLTKPIDTLRTLTVIKNALKTQYLEHLSLGKTKMKPKSDLNIFKSFIAVDAQTRNTVMEAQAAACQDTIILITGPSGSGKTMLAKLISRLRGGGEIFDCAARVDFQDFIRSAPNSATIIENADILNTNDQRTLQEYLETGEKFILTVNGNIDESLATECIWSNLYFNQHCTHLHLPPLSSRGDDLLPLFEYFLKLAADERNTTTPTFPIEVVITLKSCSLPDNATDLRAIAFQAIAISIDGQIPISFFRDLPTKYPKIADPINPDLTKAANN